MRLHRERALRSAAAGDPVAEPPAVVVAERAAEAAAGAAADHATDRAADRGARRGAAKRAKPAGDRGAGVLADPLAPALAAEDGGQVDEIEPGEPRSRITDIADV
ncbi:MAG: hypothetical protein E6J91_00765 [Deltaproteobacteria bacterium]|nr:MAG: hypothetical protein E6J91_00765 [Deltaproteobacteria bacterium]